MIAWDHRLASGGTLHIEVYRRDYGSDEEWLEAVETLQTTFPPVGP